jgi:hypothetical protein
LCDYQTWRGEHQATLSFTHQIREIAVETGDRAGQINVGRQAAAARRYLGKLAEVREGLERMIAAQSDMMRELQISSRLLAHLRFTKIHFV